MFQLIARDADLDGAKVPAQILVILSLILVVGVGVAICVERIRTHRRCNQLEKAAFAVEEDPTRRRVAERRERGTFAHDEHVDFTERPGLQLQAGLGV
ncbi:hypothetical protein GS934_00575 [Rhodococcus hoagii]|nr:hypothetical protein [Prescottella equi]NKZ86679.1 hypothetical protein [Prescottella equi]